MVLAAAALAVAAFAAGAQASDAQGRKVGGECRYVEHPGTCSIASVEKTPDSLAQAALSGGPGYAGLAVGSPTRGRG